MRQKHINTNYLSLVGTITIVTSLSLVNISSVLGVTNLQQEASDKAPALSDRISTLSHQHNGPSDIDAVDSIERRSSYNTVAHNPKSGTQVAISLERVKNPDDETGPYKKRKKFPITWLRDQYPFNSYYSKKKKRHEPKYAASQSDPFLGQYSSNQYDVLDPNPSTWVKIPDHPTATIKFQKGGQSSPGNLMPLPPPASLMPPQFMSPMASAIPSAPNMILPGFRPSMAGDMGQPSWPPANQMIGPAAMLGDVAMGRPKPFMPLTAAGPGKPASPGLMTSESQSSEYNAPAKQAADYSSGGEAPASGFGGISLSFGNGRSISFGGGQGLTIGGRAGAISIGGKNGGSSDNTVAASGYSEAKGNGHSAARPTGSYGSGGGGGQGSGYGSGSGSSYGNDYVSKHPSMSVDIPRKGKTIIHANLDMAPVKLRLHSSPRVKITTGSRDPLEKPSDEELTENEEDIFEPPVPFPKRNTTEATLNETTSAANETNGSASNTTTVSPMQLMNDINGSRDPNQANRQPPYPYGPYRGEPQTFAQFQQLQVPFDGVQQHQYAINGGGPQQQPFQQQQLPYNNNNNNQQPWPVNSNQQQQLPYNNNEQPPPPHLYGGNKQQVNYGGQHQANNHNNPVPFNEQPPQFVQLNQQQLPPKQQLQYQLVNDAPPVSPAGPNRPQPFAPPHNVPNHNQFTSQQQTYLPEQQAARPMNPAPGQQQVVSNNQLADHPSSNNNQLEGQRPALNQWRQFSNEARQKMNQYVPKNIELGQGGGDNNPKFYNGRNTNGGPTLAMSNSNYLDQPSQSLERETKDTVDVAASNSADSYARPHPNSLPVGGASKGYVANSRQITSTQQQQQPQPQPQHAQLSPSTVYQINGPEQVNGQRANQYNNNGPQQQQSPKTATNYANGRQAQDGEQQQRPIHQESIRQPVHDGSYQQVKSQHQQVQHQSHNNQQQGSSSYSSSSSSSSGQQQVKTFTFGSGGLSTHYGPADSSGGGSSGVGSNGHGNHGTTSSDGFDKKNYAAKVEKFDPDAHDKRERSKVILFLRPRISIHSANSSTTTKRPRNRQRLVHVINRPIFLNSTNMTHHEEEEFIDPDLAEAMDVANAYGHGYGYGYSRGYSTKPSTTTTKKPKTTTTTTTSAPTTTSDVDSTTSSSTSSESEGTTTNGSTSSDTTTAGTSDSTTASTETGSSSTTEDSNGSSTSSATTEASSEPTTTTESASSSTSEPSESSSTTTEAESGFSSTTGAASTTESESIPGDQEGGSASDDDSDSSAVAGASKQRVPSSTPEESEQPVTDASLDLMASSTETSEVSTSAPTTTTTTTTTTTAPKAVKSPTRSRATSRPRGLMAAAATKTAYGGSTTTTTTTTTTIAPTISEQTTTLLASTGAATEKTADPEVVIVTDPPSEQSTTGTSTTTTGTSGSTESSSTELFVTTRTNTFGEEASSSESSSPSATDNASSTEGSSIEGSSTSSSDSDSSSDDGDKSLEKRNVVQVSNITASAETTPASTNQQQASRQGIPQPMLLNPELIDKLMRNKTLVNMMSNQLKRIIDTEHMDEGDKQRIVRQVFEQMMEEKVDFSMNNVRLAVKTVSSSYRAAADKQSKRKKVPASAASELSVSKSPSPTASTPSTEPSKSASSIVMSKNGKSRSTNSRRWGSNSSNLREFGRRAAPSSTTAATSTTIKSFPVLDTALALTKSTDDGSSSGGSLSSAGTQVNSRTNTTQSNRRARRSGGKRLHRMDASGNPIVVVLLPQEKRA